VNVSPSAGILQTGQDGSSLYVLASQFPVQVAYTLDINGGNDLAQGTAMLNKSYSAATEQVSLALLTVHVVSDSGLPTTLNLTGPGGVSITSAPVGANQSASFLLPTGTYTATGSQANKSQSGQASVKDGLADSLTLNFNTATSSAGGSYATLEIILIATAVAAAVANVAVLVLRRRSLKAKMARASKAPKAPQAPKKYDPFR
jgi:hypothetical protein